MAFYESPRFPEDIGYGAVGGPGWSTDVVQVASGYEHRNSNWANSRRRYEVSYVRNKSQLDALIAFFHAMRGRAHGFRFKDPVDYLVTTSEGIIGSGVGDGTPGPFQLRKRYTSGSQYTDLDIRKPVGNTVKVYRDTTLQTAGIHYNLDGTTGLITWMYLGTSSITSHTVGSSHQFVTSYNLPSLSVGSKIYITGVLGTASNVLNNKAHTITSKTGTGPVTWIISTSTTGLTASGGQAYEYPQSSSTLTWEGEFDIPCRFDTDELKYQLIEAAPSNPYFRLNNVPIVEIRV